MGVSVLGGNLDGDDSHQAACFVCNTSGTAFGPKFDDCHDAESFLRFCNTQNTDPREIDRGNCWDDWLSRWRAWELTTSRDNDSVDRGFKGVR